MRHACVDDDQIFAQKGHSRVQDVNPSAFGANLRIPYSVGKAFVPPLESMLRPPATMGGWDLYFASLHHQDDIVPCRVGVCEDSHILYNCRTWKEIKKIDSSDEASILPYDERRMELVHTQDGVVPTGKHPVLAGCTKDGVNEYYVLYTRPSGSSTNAIVDGAVCLFLASSQHQDFLFAFPDIPV